MTTLNKNDGGCLLLSQISKGVRPKKVGDQEEVYHYPKIRHIFLASGSWSPNIHPEVLFQCVLSVLGRLGDTYPQPLSEAFYILANTPSNLLMKGGLG